VRAQIVKTIYEDVDLDPKEIITQKEAARMLRMNIESVRAAMDVGRLPTVMLPGRLRHYTLRKAVSEYMKQKAASGKNL
jgi:hypothetical protein